MSIDILEHKGWDWYCTRATVLFVRDTNLSPACLLHFSPDNLQYFERLHKSLQERQTSLAVTNQLYNYFKLFTGAHFLAFTNVAASTGDMRDFSLACAVGQSLTGIKNSLLAMNDPAVARALTNGDQSAIAHLYSHDPIIDHALRLKQKLPAIQTATIMDFITQQSTVRPDLRRAMTALLDGVIDGAKAQVLRTAGSIACH